MHKVINVLVFAKNAEDALNEANEVVNEKLGYMDRGGPFNSYADFTKDGMGMFGKDHCGPIPPVLQVSTTRFPTNDKRGLEMVNSAMENNRRTFMLSMEQIRRLIENYADDQLFDYVEGKGVIEIDEEEMNVGLAGFRYLCEDACGDFPGPGAYLYDFLGRTISRPGILRRILDDSDSNPSYMDKSEGNDPNWGPHIWKQPLWVVPFDAHY